MRMCLVISKCVPKSNGFVFTLSWISNSFILKLYCPSFSACSNFYAPPQKVAGYYVIPSELLSVCPSVRQSVRPSVR